MEPVRIVAGTAIPLGRDNVDTDTIIRIERLTGTSRASMGEFAFEALRNHADGSRDPASVLNRPEFEGAPILLAGESFGCGSSREGAVWALQGSGLRCVIAASFGDIFYGNCFQNGLLPVVLPTEDIARLMAQSAGGNARVEVDLERQVVVPPHGAPIPFEIDPTRRDALRRGLDEIGLTLAHSGAIATYEARDRMERPWVWSPGEE